MKTIPGTRSNKMLTQKVLRELNAFYAYDSAKVIKKAVGPLRINYDAGLFELYYLGNPVVSVDKAGYVSLFSGNYHDKHGNPTDSTRELINGIMDYLEAEDGYKTVKAFIKDNKGYLSIDGIIHPFDAEHSFQIVRKP